MSAAWAAALAVYGAGFVAWLIRLGFNWDEQTWDTPLPALACVFWPLALPVAVGRYVRHAADRRRLAAEEKRKWLEAPIP